MYPTFVSVLTSREHLEIAKLCSSLSRRNQVLAGLRLVDELSNSKTVNLGLTSNTCKTDSHNVHIIKSLGCQLVYWDPVDKPASG